MCYDQLMCFIILRLSSTRAKNVARKGWWSTNCLESRRLSEAATAIRLRAQQVRQCNYHKWSQVKSRLIQGDDMRLIEGVTWSIDWLTGWHIDRMMGWQEWEIARPGDGENATCRFISPSSFSSGIFPPRATLGATLRRGESAVGHQNVTIGDLLPGKTLCKTSTYGLNFVTDLWGLGVWSRFSLMICDLSTPSS